MKKFREKEIYTIQQYQYKEKIPYEWVLKYFKKLSVGEWDSFCDNYLTIHDKELVRAWRNENNQTNSLL